MAMDMIKSELLQIIANGENSGVEFKQDDIRPEQLAKEIVALANLQGGKILLGIADDGTIRGISRPDIETWVMDTVFGRYVHPLILPYYEEILMEDGKRIAVVSFPQGISKPYVVRHNDREDVYIRVGSTSRRATREQQARLYSVGGLLHADLMPVPGTSVKSLDFARLANYLHDISVRSGCSINGTGMGDSLAASGISRCWRGWSGRMHYRWTAFVRYQTT